ncbi:MAG: hypothetical protein ACI3Z0_10995 [Candidatus Cryptobacteroides sp.]
MTEIPASASFTTLSGTFVEADTYSALYPYAEGTVFADGKVNAEVPAIQTPVAGSFDDGVNVAVAQGAGNALSFKNVCGYLKFTVPEGYGGYAKVPFADYIGEFKNVTPTSEGNLVIGVQTLSVTTTSSTSTNTLCDAHINAIQIFKKLIEQ